MLKIAVDAQSMFSSENEDVVPGVCLDIVAAMYGWKKQYGLDISLMIVSRGDPESNVRMLSDMHHMGMTNVSGVFTSGEDFIPYISGNEIDIFFGHDEDDVQKSVDLGIPAAVMHGIRVPYDTGCIKLAFDGDAVLFDEESEKFFQASSVEEFHEYELGRMDVPLAPGPLFPFLERLHTLRDKAQAPIFKSALTTARSGIAAERAIRTLRSYGLMVDKAMFCGNFKKIGMLRAFGAHAFFDDSDNHITPAREHMPAGKVPWRTPKVSPKP